MKKSIIGTLAFTLMIFTIKVMACQFNTDCDVGSKCIKNGGLYGYCMGGMNPGNSYDLRPATDLYRGGGLHVLLILTAI